MEGANADEKWSNYVEAMARPTSWGSTMELAILANNFNVNVALFTTDDKDPQWIPCSSKVEKSKQAKTVILYYADCHYEWVRLKWEVDWKSTPAEPQQNNCSTF